MSKVKLVSGGAKRWDLSPVVCSWARWSLGGGLCRLVKPQAEGRAGSTVLWLSSETPVTAPQGWQPPGLQQLSLGHCPRF